MSTWTRLTFACVLGSFCGVALADSSRTDFEQSFIGREWIQGHPPSDQCEPLGGYMLQSNKKSLNRLGVDSLKCNDRELQLLEQFMTDYAKGNKVKALDALLLPKLKPGELFMEQGECELNGKTDTNFIALVHLGRRDKVTWKNGVRAAWKPNLEAGKFEELSTKDIVCWRQTPP
jgi:hypothetical protein